MWFKRQRRLTSAQRWKHTSEHLFHTWGEIKSLNKWDRKSGWKMKRLAKQRDVCRIWMRVSEGLSLLQVPQLNWLLKLLIHSNDQKRTQIHADQRSRNACWDPRRPRRSATPNGDELLLRFSHTLISFTLEPLRSETPSSTDQSNIYNRPEPLQEGTAVAESWSGLLPCNWWNC